MRSHSVPKCLLEQFAYEHIPTKSLRLWRFAKGRPPFPRASPKTATTVEGYFADPKNAQLEIQIEAGLATEIEDPVHKFIPQLSLPSFRISETQRRQMTRYILLLFHRSMARRQASKPMNEIMVDALQGFLKNELQLATVAAHWGLCAYFDGVRLNRLITTRDVKRSAQQYLDHYQTEESFRETFIEGILRARYSFDERMFNGEWRTVWTSQEDPFILSDSPVITWERLGPRFSYGLGLHRADVEVLLPVSPTACLHILPDVGRTRPTLSPGVNQINAAQAAFAYRDCFASRCTNEIDAIVQTHASSVQIGKNAFTARGLDYDNMFYDVLMTRRARY